MANLKAFKSVIVFLLLALLCSGSVMAAEVNAGKSESKGGAVADWALASRLAEYGKRTADPLALLVAAQIMQAAPLRDVVREEVSEDTTVADPAGKDTVIPDAAGLLAQAKELAGDDLQLVTIIAATAQKQGTRGCVGTACDGPQVHEDRILPNATDVYRITFRGGELAEVAVIGDGDNDLDLYVYDEFDSLITYDEDAADQCYVSWTPLWTAEFTIKIKNRDTEIYSDYRLLTNQ